jgi:phosphatidylinositol alpha 1,6-mannosyltransferase
MRIAIFSEVYWPMVSGVSLVLQRLVAALEQRGHVVRVYAPSYELPGGSGDLRHVFRVPSRRLFIYPDVQWGTPHWPTIRADFAAFRPDLVHVATEFAMGTTGIRLAREFRLPIVASAHTDYERYSTRYGLEWLMGAGWHYLRWFYGHAERVFCPSGQYQQHLQHRGVTRTGIWSRGVDLGTFSPAHRSETTRQSLGIAPDQLMVLHVGRLAAEKNVLLLMEAWEQIRLRRGDARLVVVGTGPLEAALRNTTPDNVILAGVRRGEQLSQLYASADLFAFPSSTETFGNVLLEAMGSGVPSLAVRAGGVLDFAEHNANAWLVEPDSAAAFGDGMATLLHDRELRLRLGMAGVASARARDWNSIFDALVGEYCRLLVPADVDLAA